MNRLTFLATLAAIFGLGKKPADPLQFIGRNGEPFNLDLKSVKVSQPNFVVINEQRDMCAYQQKEDGTVEGITRFKSEVNDPHDNQFTMLYNVQTGEYVALKHKGPELPKLCD